MAFREIYRRQVSLLVRVLPLIAEESCFALKGGTAINLFIRDMPRLSVDIDLTYVPVAPRTNSLAAIDAAMKRIAVRVKKAIPDAQINTSQVEGAVTRLIVRQGVQTKSVTPFFVVVLRSGNAFCVRVGRGRFRLCRNRGRILRRSLCRQDRGGPRSSASA